VCDSSVQPPLLSLFKPSFFAMQCDSGDLQAGGQPCYENQASDPLKILYGMKIISEREKVNS